MQKESNLLIMLIIKCKKAFGGKNYKLRINLFIVPNETDIQRKMYYQECPLNYKKVT